MCLMEVEVRVKPVRALSRCESLEGIHFDTCIDVPKYFMRGADLGPDATDKICPRSCFQS